MHRQAAFVVGRNAFVGVEVDIGKAQGHAAILGQAIGLGVAAIAEFDAPSLQLQGAAASARALVDHGRRRTGIASPHQGAGLDQRHIRRVAIAIDRRSRQ